MEKNTDWIKQAHELGLVVNAWTVNAEKDMDKFLAAKADNITTNEPELLFRKIKDLR